MPLPAGLVEAWFRIGYGATVCQTHLAILSSDGIAITPTQVNDFFTEWQTRFAPRYSAAIGLEGGHVLIGTASGDVRIDSSIAPVVGTNAGDQLPPMVSVLVTKQTATGGRHGKGRMFWPGPTEGTVDDFGNIDLAEVAAWDLAMNGLLATGVIITELGAASEPALVVELAPGALSAVPLTGFQTDTRVARQDRRYKRRT